MIDRSREEAEIHVHSIVKGETERRYIKIKSNQ